MPSLHIFNPDTDYALASDRRYYTPPANVIAVRRQLALLPSIYANDGDAILLLDRPLKPIAQLEYYQTCADKSIRIITPESLESFKSEFRDHNISPWGWNKSIRQILSDSLGDMPGMPSESEIEAIRDLSHRRTTIPMMRELSDILTDEIEIPVEITDIDMALMAYKSDNRRFFKAPWSSSGRGILLTDDLEPRHVEPWLRGIIKKQGSVMMEKVYDKASDFASEWICRNGNVKFLGYSVFETSRRGKYHCNVKGNQRELESLIQKQCNCDISHAVELQKRALTKLIAPFYNGVLGIDMLSTKSGNINPCVEINLRHTMGMIDILGKGSPK